MTVESLRKEGHQVYEFTLPNGMQAAGPWIFRDLTVPRAEGTQDFHRTYLFRWI